MSILHNGVAASLAAALLTLAVPAAAQLADDTTAQWSAQAQRSLRDGLAQPFWLGQQSLPAGVTDIGFMLDANGRARSVTVARSSGERRLDSAAVAAVRRLRTRAVPPAGVVGRPVVARIFIAPGDQPLGVAARARLVAATATRMHWTATGAPMVLAVR